MALRIFINSPFGAFDNEVLLPTYPSNWEYVSAVTSRWSLAAISVQSPSYSAPPDLRHLVIYDLHTDTQLASRVLANNQLLLPSYNSEGHYHIANLGDAASITITTHSLVSGAESYEDPVAPPAVIEWPLLNLPEGSFTFLSYVPATQGREGVILVQFDAANDLADGVYAIAFDNDGVSHLIDLPPGDWIDGEAIAQDGQLMFFLSGPRQSATEDGVSYRYDPSVSQPHDWTELPSRFDYLDARHDLAGPDSVIRDGNHAFDLLVNWDGQASGHTMELPDGGVLILSSYWSDQDPYGFERWLVFRDGQVEADKRFDSPEGRLMRTLADSNPDDPSLYVQQINAVFEDGAPVQSGQPALTVHRLTLRQAGDLLDTEANTAASSANQIATFSGQALMGRELEAGDLVWLGSYQPTSSGALLHVISAGTNNPEDASGQTERIVFSRDPANGQVESNWLLPGLLSSGINPMLHNQYVFTVHNLETSQNGTYLADATASIVRPLAAPEYQHLLRLQALDTDLDLILGSSANDNLQGTNTNDHIASLGGNDTINGGLGTDTLYLAGDASDYTMTREAGGWTLTHSQSESRIELTGVERVHFADEMRELVTQTVANDFNGDGKSDILWRNSATGVNQVWSQSDHGVWTKINVGSNDDMNWQFVGAGDFDGDGRTDILWRNTVTGSNILWQAGDSRSPSSIAAMRDLNWQVVAVGDFSGDRRADILWRHSITGSNVIWEDGDSSAKNNIGALRDLNWQVIGAGDFDGDGRSDVLWRNVLTGRNFVWGGADKSQRIEIGNISNKDWQLAGIGDFNGDGCDDILWRNSATGGNMVWDDGLLVNKRSLGTVSDQDWRVAQVGDFFGDGSADILWYNVKNGRLMIWGDGERGNRIDIDRQSIGWGVLIAESGKTVVGGMGNNTLFGSAFNDRLVGDAGDDILFGGPGVDQFVFNSLVGTDLIRDFSSGQDTLVFDSAVFSGITAQNITERLGINAQGCLRYDDGLNTVLHIATLQNNGSVVTALSISDYLVI